ncbi:MAG: hypothetical protein ABFD65_13385, partial [Candidatus Polarisedimenticolia bacterium]
LPSAAASACCPKAHSAAPDQLVQSPFGLFGANLAATPRPGDAVQLNPHIVTIWISPIDRVVPHIQTFCEFA